MPEGSHRVAVIDIGTNSTRLLVADVAGGRVVAGRAAQHGDPAGPRGRPLRPALGRGDRGRLRGDRRVRRDCPRSWAPRASTRSRPVPCATPRTAAPSSPSCASASRSRPGSSTARRRRASPTSAPPPSSRPAEPTLVVDIGGGSTELIVGTGDEISFHTSLQAGVVRHSERHIASDPPTAIELEALAADVRGLIEAAVGAGVEAERRHRRRRHPDLAGRDRDGAGALRPGAGPRPRPHPALDPADALPARLHPARASGSRSPACTPTGRRRSSPAS